MPKYGHGTASPSDPAFPATLRGQRRSASENSGVREFGVVGALHSLLPSVMTYESPSAIGQRCIDCTLSFTRLKQKAPDCKLNTAGFASIESIFKNSSRASEDLDTVMKESRHLSLEAKADKIGDADKRSQLLVKIGNEIACLVFLSETAREGK